MPAPPLGGASAGAAGATGAAAQREWAGVGDGAVEMAAEEAEIEEGGEGWVAEALGFLPEVVDGWGGAGGLPLDPGSVECAAIAARLAPPPSPSY